MRLGIFKILILILAATLGGCSSTSKTAEEDSQEPRDILYYADRTTASLIIPPDLTKPEQTMMDLGGIVARSKEDTANFSAADAPDASTNQQNPTTIEVKKFADRRWLLVDKNFDEVWILVRDFLKSHNFAIAKSDKNIGVMETNFLERHQTPPERSLGFIRSFLQRTIDARYVLPVADKYRIRMESADDKTEIYLSLSAIEEVLVEIGGDAENTIWQARRHDVVQENEMLYRLMLYLGSPQIVAERKIENPEETPQKVIVEQGIGIDGFAKLTFALDRPQTWRQVGWALDALNIEIEDKDMREGSYYVNFAETERGFFADLFGSAVKESFQILVQQVDSDKTEVSFNDLTEKNMPATVEFSRTLFANIAKQFN